MAVRNAAGESKPEAYHSHPPTPSCQDSSFSEWGTLRISMSRERCLGKGASWRAGVGRVRRATFSASCSHKEFEHG